jgi:hypothetical protein
MIRRTAIAVVAGLGVAAVYTISPLTICVLACGAAMVPLAYRGLLHRERRWLTAILVSATLVRVVAIGGMLVRNTPHHDDQFVGAESGDEAYAMARALRVRDIVNGSPVSKYDFFVAYDEYGRNSYINIVSALQVIFGPTPYSLRLLNTLLFMAGALLLFRLCHAAFGPLPAFIGLVLVLFWPTLFAWSISLLKEPLYFFGVSLVLTSAVRVVRASRWRSRAISIGIGAAAAFLIKDLRPSALILVATGIALGFFARALLASTRRLAVAVAAAAAALAVAASVPAVEHRLVAGLDAAAKTHSGHVFTVGHSYKLLDPGFYVNPTTPAASTLTLTRDQAGRFVVRALGSFFLVPLPWQLQSARELAYMPEQLAWYALVLLLPVGFAAGCRRDPLVTCILVGYTVPTAAALALTNGNVGTLLRLRGLVIPCLVWIGAVGLCAVIGTAGQKARMPFIDENGRVFGRVNLFDAALAASVLVLIPVAYGTFLLFRTPAPRITSVAGVPITSEERRVAGGSRLTAKLKVRGSGLRPMLRASIGSTPALGFVFEDPNSADVLVGEVPPGTHDFVLYDGLQEVARLPKSVTIESSAPPRLAAVGTLVRMDQALASTLTTGALFPKGPTDVVVRLGPPRAAPDGWQRAAEILLQCDPDPRDEGCAVGGVSMTSTPLPIIRLTGPSGSSLAFAVRELFPATPSVARRVVVRLASAPELLNLVRAGDRDDCLDDRAAAVVSVGGRRGAGGVSEIDVTLRLGVDGSPEGWRYRGRVMKTGAPFTLTTERYVFEGIVLSVDEAGAGELK